MVAVVNRPQNSDSLTLQQTLDVMERLGYTSESYRNGYRDAVIGEQVADWSQEDEGFDYRRGYWQGQQARERGAHQERNVS